MKPRIITFAAVAVALIGLAVAYFALSSREEDTEVEAEAPYYTIFEREEGELESFSISSGGETLVFLPDAEDETGWRLSHDERLKLDPYYTRSLLRGVVSLGTEELAAQKADNLSDFGLEPPQAVAEISFKTGDNVVILLGNMTPDKQYYYLMRQGDPAVYLVDTYAGEKYAFKLDDMIDKGVPGITAESLQYAYIRSGELELEIAPSPESDSNLEMYGIVSLKMTKPYPERDVYLADFSEQVLTGLADIRFDELVETGLSNLAEYGLDTPELEVVIRDEETEFSLIVGNDAGDGKFYAKRGGDEMIFTVDGAQLEGLRKLDVLSFMDRFVALINIDTVERLTVDEGGTITEILINMQESGEDGEKTYSPTINGKAVEFDEFASYYQGLIGLSYDAEINGFTPEGAPAFDVTYYLNTGESVKHAYYDYDDNFYAVSTDNAPVSFAIGKQSINTVQRLLRQLMGE